MKTQNIIILSLIIILTIIISGCNQTTTSNVVKENEYIEIGLIAPLTGPFAEWGQSIAQASELALKDTNNKIKINYQDSACDPKQTVTIAERILNLNKNKIIIGPGCVTGLKAIAQITDKNNALMFSTGLLDDSVFEEHSSVINLATQISTEANAIARYIAKEKHNKVAIIYGDNAFGKEFSLRLPEALKENNIKTTITESSSLDETDFRSLIIKLIKVNPDAIFIHQGEKQIGLFVKQLREMNYDTQIYSYYGAESESVLNSGGSALEGIKYTYPYNSAEDSIRKKEFEQRYKEKYNKEPSATSYFVYDGIILLDKAFDKCKSDDVNCIKSFFINHEKYIGISGDMKFESDGKLIRDFGIKTISNNKFEWLVKKI